MAKKYNVSLIVDELNSRQVFDGREYVHLCAQEEIPDTMVTIMGPSKTEPLSGYRLGAAFGSEYVITRMEKLRAIVSLRAAGYYQAVLTDNLELIKKMRTLCHFPLQHSVMKRWRRGQKNFVLFT